MWWHIAPALTLLALTSRHHYGSTCQTNGFQNLQKCPCPLQRAETMQRKSVKNCGHMPGEAPWRTDVPKKKVPTLIQAALVASDPPVTTKRRSDPPSDAFPQTPMNKSFTRPHSSQRWCQPWNQSHLPVNST